jgi:hypothetical protein
MLVVIDPLYQCVTGSLVQDAVMMEAIKGLSTISRATGAAVLLMHHEPRGSQHLFGSMLLDAALDAQIHVDRDKDVVTVKVELLKNGQPPKRPFVYQMEAGYLAPATLAMGGKDAATGAPFAEKDRYAQILERLPEIAIRESEARKLIEGLLTGKTPEAKRQAWHRVLKAMTKSRSRHPAPGHGAASASARTVTRDARHPYRVTAHVTAPTACRHAVSRYRRKLRQIIPIFA